MKTIVVVESGWVFLADGVEEVGDTLRLTGAASIRVWGTEAGLGQIALHGPTKKTILDPCGSPIVPMGKVLFTLPCTF